MVRFVIVTTQRSGSTMLVQALRRHREVVCYQELFQRHCRERLAFLPYATASWPRRAARFLAAPWFTGRYLDLVYSSDGQAGAIGFKLMYNHLRRHWELPRLFGRFGVRVVHLVRENLLKTHASAVAAQGRRLWLAREEVPPRTIVVPTGDLVDALDRRRRAIEVHRRRLRPFPHLEIRYEQLLADWEGEAGRILRFLDVDDAIPLRTDFVKINPDRLDDLIENYSEVAARLAGTPFERFLHPTA